ncbi:ubiquitin carboxyl-terminal hydrolase [Baffinella frigidus]|nr:ubiquitin carboxyl-terminal hydrolase [Cryptophyta sp. CCMP2293]
MHKTSALCAEHPNIYWGGSDWHECWWVWSIRQCLVVEMASMHKTSALCVENPNIYFAKQVINNACGTQALLNIMMNAEGISVGKELEDFRSFTSDFPADIKGGAMSNSDMMPDSQPGKAMSHSET